MPKARAQEKRAYCISVSWVRLGKSVPSGQTGTERAHTAHRVYVTVRVRLCDINTYLHGQNLRRPLRMTELSGCAAETCFCHHKEARWVLIVLAI